MYNHTGLQGRLTADPELRYTQQGTAITSFTLASDTGRKTTARRSPTSSSASHGAHRPSSSAST